MEGLAAASLTEAVESAHKADAIIYGIHYYDPGLPRQLRRLRE
jgi:hypothetical protein